MLAVGAKSILGLIFPSAGNARKWGIERASVDCQLKKQF